MSAKDGTGAGLLEFLEWAGARGEMNDTTARARAAAVRAVLGLFDAPDDVAVRDLDVANTLDRFETLNRTKYTSGSMATYKQRFERALASYLAWLDKDPDWKNAGAESRAEANGSRAPRPRKVLRKVPSTSASASTTATTGTTGESATQSSATVQMIPYDLPLRPDLLVRLTLPVGLTSADADRIAAFVRSLAFDSLPAAPRDAQSARGGGA